MQEEIKPEAGDGVVGNLVRATHEIWLLGEGPDIPSRRVPENSFFLVLSGPEAIWPLPIGEGKYPREFALKVLLISTQDIWFLHAMDYVNLCEVIS